MPVQYVRLSVQLLKRDHDHLEALTAKLQNMMSRTELARQALLLGLAASQPASSSGARRIGKRPSKLPEPYRRQP